MMNRKNQKKKIVKQTNRKHKRKNSKSGKNQRPYKTSINFPLSLFSSLEGEESPIT